MITILAAMLAIDSFFADYIVCSVGAKMGQMTAQTSSQRRWLGTVDARKDVLYYD